MKQPQTSSRTRAGFTIVELLIVIVVIAILAAITIVTYNGIVNRTYDAAVQHDLRQIQQRIALFHAEDGRLPDVNDLNGLGIALGNKQAYAIEPVTSHNIMYCRHVPTDRFGIVSWSRSGNLYFITNSQGVSAFSGTVIYSPDWETNPTNHACKVMLPGWELGDGNWRGYAADDTTDGPWRTWVGGN